MNRLRLAALPAAAVLSLLVPATGAHATPAPADPNPTCSASKIKGNGSPGYISFTVHITANPCGWAVRAYCDWSNNNDTGPTIYTTGSSKSYCEAPADYGWQYYQDGSWHRHKIGHSY